MTTIDRSLWSCKWTHYDEVDPTIIDLYKQYMKDPTGWSETCWKWPKEDIYIQICKRDDTAVGFMTALISHQNKVIYMNEFNYNTNYIKMLMTQHTDAFSSSYKIVYQN